MYLRQSVDRSGEGLAVERQRAACIELVERNGWQLVEMFTENDTSATSGKRVEWTRLLDGIRSGRFDVLVCWHTDRLYRRVRDLVDLVELAEKHALRIASVKAADLDLTTPAGRMLAGMLGHAQRYEVEQKSARQVAANAQRARAGQMGWTRRPYGYDLRNGKVVVIPSEADDLRRAAERVLDDQTLAAIVRDLNAAGRTSTVGGKWNVTSLRRALLNPRLSGHVTHNGEHVGTGTWEPIFLTDQQERLTAKLRNPSRRTQISTVRKYLLSGTLRCGCEGCGQPVFASPAGVGTARYMTYRCRTPHLTRRLDLVDEVVVGTVLARLRQPDAATLLLPDTDLGELRKELSELRERRDMLAVLLTDGLLSVTAVRSQASVLTQRITAVESKVSAAMGESVAAGVAGAADVNAAWQALSLNRQRTVVDELMTVTLLPSGRGQRFDPAHVAIAWKGAP